jgi:hypothetical protein
LATSILERMSVLSTPAAMVGATEVFTSPQWASSPSAAPAGSSSVQRAEDDSTTVARAAAPAPTTDHAPATEQGRPSDQYLSNLSRWLYPLIRYRLKGDLREDRERAGLLTDHYRRW